MGYLREKEVAGACLASGYLHEREMTGWQAYWA
jgi:hypothetical protein